MIEIIRNRLLNLGLLVAAGLTVNTPTCVEAHPHVWVSSRTTVLYDADRRITGFRHSWTFDEFYSSFAVQGLDKNGDGAYSREELAELAEVNIKSLKEFEYFTFPKVGETLLARSEPKDYWLELKDSILTLHFTLPLAEPLDPENNRFEFAVYDPTFYISFSFAKTKPVELASSAPEGCEVNVKLPDTSTADAGKLGESFFSSLNANSDFGAQFAQVAVVSCQKQ